MEFKITEPKPSRPSKPSDGARLKRLKRQFLIASAGFLCLLLCAIYSAYKFDTVGFVEPDTCWILALGKNIWEHNAVPSADPFSYTLPLSAAVGMPQPFVVHQWLFDFLSYATFRAGKLLALTAVCSTVAAVAFIVLPWRICLRANAPTLAVYAITIATGISLALRPYVRPEIATCLCLALWLTLLQELRFDAEAATNQSDQSDQSGKAGISWKMVVAFSLVMLFWCNLHTGFIAGLGILLIFALSFVLQDVSAKKKFSTVTRTSLACLLVSGLATLINPVGIKLWTYLPVLFGLGRYFHILEMQGIRSDDFLDPDFSPFFILLFISIFSIFVYARKRAAFRLPLSSPIRLASLVLIGAAGYGAFHVSRMVPFCSLILAMESATLLGLSRAGVKRPYCGDSPLSVLLKATGKLPSSARYNRGFDCLLAMTAALAAVILANRVGALYMPEESRYFFPPVRAIQYLRNHPQSGPLFNDALIGSMLTWYLPGVKVFVDSRFDEYGEQILADYQNVIKLERGALSVLDTYGIDWIFVGARDPITMVLKRVPTWKIIYSDEDAFIFRRALSQQKGAAKKP